MDMLSRRSRLFLAIFGVIVGLAAGVFILTSVFPGQAERKDFADNAAFLKQGRLSLSLCVSDMTGDRAPASDIVSQIQGARDANKSSLWKNSFLESEPLDVTTPCPTGPTVGKGTIGVEDYLTSIRVVDKPGPYVLYVFVVSPETLDILARLNLDRVIPQEYIDPDPNQPAGYQQVATALYVNAEEFRDQAYLARQIAESLGCTERCSATAGPEN